MSATSSSPSSPARDMYRYNHQIPSSKEKPHSPSTSRVPNLSIITSIVCVFLAQAPWCTHQIAQRTQRFRDYPSILRRELQAFILISQNCEKLRLRKENKGLKLTVRKGDASSIAGGSILESSISRSHQRSISIASLKKLLGHASPTYIDNGIRAPQRSY